MSFPQDLLRNGPTRLRTLEPGDADWLIRWENDPSHWAVSGTTVPYSRAALQALCEGHQDLHTAGQLRWIIEEMGKPVGAVDLYEYSGLHQRSGVGILVDASHRGQGTGGRALQIALRHAKEVLLMKSLHAEVHADNPASLQLFSAAGFQEIGRFTAWTRTQNGWRDAVLFQAVLNPEES
ncbi:MAG: GNAT family N-acetyltransferase [Flavobacteriales bacterium]|nr:GNAT family N-acetyltransferase [Flavobacteriales bacterium]